MFYYAQTVSYSSVDTFEESKTPQGALPKILLDNSSSNNSTSNISPRVETVCPQLRLHFSQGRPESLSIKTNILTFATPRAIVVGHLPDLIAKTRSWYRRTKR